MTAHTDWHLLAEQASMEMDSEKLNTLIQELNRALDEQDASRTTRRGAIRSSFPPATADPLSA